MSSTDSPLAGVQLSARTAKLSALSGCGWGLVAYSIGHAALGRSIWGGIIAAPLIGVVIGRLSRPIGARSRSYQIAAALFDLYLAATCFAVAMAVFDLVWGPRNVTFFAALTGSVLAVLWGVTFTGYFLVLWPLSVFNHRLVWHADAARCVVPPQVSFTATRIRSVALKIMAVAVFGYVAFALLQIIHTSGRYSAASGMPWWVVTNLMGWSNWFLFGSLIFITAPILASAATRAAGSEGPTTATYGDLIGLVGFAVFVFPFLFFAATHIVMAVKVSLVQSWPTEGTVFWASYYYRNVFGMYLPWLVVGTALIGVRRLIGDRW
jgi:hypothetical protein